MFCITQTIIDDKLSVKSSAKFDNLSFSYAFYIYINGELIEKIMYTNNNSIDVDTSMYQGSLFVKCFFKNLQTSEITILDADTIYIPRQTINIADVSFDSNIDVDISFDNIQIPIRFFRKNIAQKLYILLNGALAVDAQEKYYPYFNRISWHEKFDGHCLYIYDASLNLVNDYTLGWYRGIEENKLHQNYIDLIKYVGSILDIQTKDIIIYGSSGGGFAALKFAEDIKGVTAVAINPQYNVLNFIDRVAVAKFESVFNSTKDPFAIKINSQKFKKNESKIILVQNIQDRHHYEEHFKPLWQNLSD